jgi:hypothetical protein
MIGNADNVEFDSFLDSFVAEIIHRLVDEGFVRNFNHFLSLRPFNIHRDEEGADVNDSSFIISNLDVVADAKRFLCEKNHPRDNTKEDVLKGKRKSCCHKADEEREIRKRDTHVIEDEHDCEKVEEDLVELPEEESLLELNILSEDIINAL